MTPESVSLCTNQERKDRKCESGRSAFQNVICSLLLDSQTYFLKQFIYSQDQQQNRRGFYANLGSIVEVLCYFFLLYKKRVLGKISFLNVKEIGNKSLCIIKIGDLWNISRNVTNLPITMEQYFLLMENTVL